MAVPSVAHPGKRRVGRILPASGARGYVRMMLCPKCGKESHNVRVCAFCQTPYPTGSVDPHSPPRNTRATASMKAVGLGGNPRTLITRLSPAQRWGIIGLLGVVTVGYYFATRERVIPVGVAVPNLIGAPMTPSEAAGILRTVNKTAQVEVRDGECFVRIASVAFPQKRAGQLALAQQYARADEIVEGRPRAITFLDPDGNRFARSEPGKGVAMTR